MRIRNAFTMIELIFVIVVMGIIGKFGVEFLAQAYQSFIFSSVNNALQTKSASAVEFIGSRLQYRIKDSVIARTAVGVNPPTPIGSAAGTTFTVLEWVGSDIDGYRGVNTPFWSGIIDIGAGTSGLLNSPGTSSVNANTLIATLSNGGSTLNNSALYFIGSNSDAIADYAWDGNAIINQSAAIHPILGAGVNFTPRRGDNSVANNFINGSDVYEYYKLAWTAYAIVYTPGANSMGTLTLWYDYQPWNGETSANGKSAVIMEEVSAFQFMAIGSIIKIQVCTKSELLGDYSLCKEKTIF